MVVYDKLGHFGRLGNIMFEVASTIGIADTLGIEFGFNDYPPWPFDSKLPTFQASAHRFEEYPLMDYRKEVFSQGTNFTLDGYFQSEKYFIDSKEKILKFFLFNRNISDYILKKYQLALRLNPVSLHVRRGDYLSQGWYMGDHWHLARMAELKDRLILVFSDDVAYCEKLFADHKNIMYIWEDEINSLCLMSKCKSHVISNSTFSWWGSYLSQSDDVIYPDKFDIINGGACTFPNKDFYPERWKMK